MDTIKPKSIITGIAYLYILAKLFIFMLIQILFFVTQFNSMHEQEIGQLGNYFLLLPWFIISVVILIVLRNYLKNNGTTLYDLVKDQVIIKTVGLLLALMGIVDLLWNIVTPILMIKSFIGVDNSLMIILPNLIPSLGSLLQIILGIFVLLKKHILYKNV